MPFLPCARCGDQIECDQEDYDLANDPEAFLGGCGTICASCAEERDADVCTTCAVEREECSECGEMFVPGQLWNGQFRDKCNDCIEAEYN
ncbi:hypothetical protein HNR46_000095 [Haloferula luteola]|uniref:Uncharacterized protein n=1 Tax=Haloferula luteola TaxID=595692 RepID=A0A840V2I1_9BACT|nr:hypothetical protein [Haloferula luteola]MBB5349874.1 hypothetical protein [Haloferula luteola]